FLKNSLLTIALCSPFITPAVLANDLVETAYPLLYSVAWKQTAAEYQALYYQGFNIARMHLELALAKQKKG
ncbi:hypothetical protein V6255_19035, partial [Psychromonas arctica]